MLARVHIMCICVWIIYVRAYVCEDACVRDGLFECGTIACDIVCVTARRYACACASVQACGCMCERGEMHNT